MSRKKKTQARSGGPPPSARKQSIRSNGLLVLTLVLIGLFASFLVYLKTESDAPPAPVTAAAPPASRAEAQPETLPERPQPKYDFYNDLPQRELVIEREAPPPPARKPPEPTPEKTPEPDRTAQQQPREPTPSRPEPEPQQQAAAGGRYLIQAGAYKLYSQADRARARLAMLNIDARIEQATSNGLPIYRVRIGPLSASEADSVSRRLSNNDIQSFRLRAN
ncbi:MAG: SPOR domain-containing protein [Candidatus Competibacterales bacterium]|nr:SPOR domain-containing protein [Candidatus Competibacterales bacterium]